MLSSEVARLMSAAKRDERLRRLSFVLTQHTDHVPTRIGIAGREVELPPDVYRPLVETLAEDDYVPKTLSRIESHARCATIPFAQLVQAVLTLTSLGSAHPAQSPSAIEEASPRCDALNACIVNRAAANGSEPALTSPVIGGGVLANRNEKLFVRVMARGHAGPAQGARDAWDFLDADVQASATKAKPLAPREESLARLLVDAEAFATTRLPLFKALQIT